MIDRARGRATKALADGANDLRDGTLTLPDIGSYFPKEVLNRRNGPNGYISWSTRGSGEYEDFSRARMLQISLQHAQSALRATRHTKYKKVLFVVPG